MCRQAIPFPGTQKYQNMMSRLAAMHSPPSGFWKFSRNTKIQVETDDIHIFHNV